MIYKRKSETDDEFANAKKVKNNPVSFLSLNLIKI